MEKLRFVLIISLLALLIVSCTIGQDKGASEAVAAAVYESIKQKNFDTAVSFYSTQFYEKTTKEEWLEALKSINAKLGDLLSYELVSWNVRKVVGTADSGTYTQLEYKVTYSKYPSQEKLTIFKPTSGGGARVLGHNINSAGFLQK